MCYSPIMRPEDKLPEDWSEAQNALFAKVYRWMIANRTVFPHPAAAQMSIEHWQTISHNAAWCAAELLEAASLRLIDDLDQVIAESPQELNG